MKNGAVSDKYWRFAEIREPGFVVFEYGHVWKYSFLLAKQKKNTFVCGHTKKK